MSGPSAEARSTEALVAIDGYELVRELGRGGMGRVYEAIETSTGARVALKRMRGSLHTDDSARERFRREADVLSRIDHPNVAAVRRFGESGGTFFLAMELVEGISLSRFAASQGPISPADAKPLLDGICLGLEAVHRAGVVHRDLKPANVLLANGDLARPKLVDFGVARAEWLPRLTLTGVVVGTPRFMAPEQLAGATDLDARVDVYAAGLLLYCVLAGRDPFPASDEEVLVSVLTGRGARLGHVRPDIPVSIESVVHRAMAHVREARMASARELREAYERALRTPDSDPSTARGKVRTRTTQAAIVLVRAPATRDVVVRIASTFGSRPIALGDALLCAIDAGESDASVRAAECAAALRAAIPDLSVSVVSGDPSSLLDRARRVLAETRDGVGTDRETASRVGPAFDVVPDGERLTLRPSGGEHRVTRPEKAARARGKSSSRSSLLLGVLLALPLGVAIGVALLFALDRGVPSVLKRAEPKVEVADVGPPMVPVAPDTAIDDAGEPLTDGPQAAVARREQPSSQAEVDAPVATDEGSSTADDGMVWTSAGSSASGSVRPPTEVEARNDLGARIDLDFLEVVGWERSSLERAVRAHSARMRSCRSRAGSNIESPFLVAVYQISGGSGGQYTYTTRQEEPASGRLHLLHCVGAVLETIDLPPAPDGEFVSYRLRVRIY